MCNGLKQQTAVVFASMENSGSTWEGKSEFVIVWIYVVVQSKSVAVRLTQDAIFAFFYKSLNLNALQPSG